MISSEMPEVTGLADRVYVMREGVITGELAADQIDEQRIIQLATQKRAVLRGCHDCHRIHFSPF